MKVIYYSDDTITPANNIKHVINFFGIMGCMKVYVLNKHASTEQKCELVQHYFDYPYFSSIVNPELFQKELNDEEKKINRRMVSLWLFFTTLFIASIISLYLAHQNQKSKKVLIGLVFASAVLLILATVCFIVGCLWMLFDFIKKKFVAHRIKSFLENEVSFEQIEHYKKELIGENPVVNAEAHKSGVRKRYRGYRRVLLAKKECCSTI